MPFLKSIFFQIMVVQYRADRSAKRSPHPHQPYRSFYRQAINSQVVSPYQSATKANPW